jgi:hypothetical protein
MNHRAFAKFGLIHGPNVFPSCPTALKGWNEMDHNTFECTDQG